MNCTYCNAKAECKDHVVVGASKKHNNGGATVPACILCTDILSRHPSEVLRDRAEYCYARYRKWLVYNNVVVRKIPREEIARRMEWIKDKWLMASGSNGSAHIPVEGQ